jgi:hypothetical protein
MKKHIEEYALRKLGYVPDNKSDISKVARDFWKEVNELLEYRKHHDGKSYLDSAYYFLEKYNISGISTDGILKHYTRSKNKQRFE